MTMSSAKTKFDELFPPVLELNSPPLISTMPVENRPTPRYLLGWVMPVVDAANHFGRGGDQYERDLLGYFNRGVLSPNWTKITENSPILQKHPQYICPPRVMHCPKDGVPLDEDFMDYVIIRIARNSPSKGMALYEEHKEEIIEAAMKTMNFPLEKRAELKWYRL
ncbi:hypothetical protein F5879DRAFT_1000407 [Lentinula edodes]|uniref:uncharacterized protein n=1 Tax=Lentinula edodes TaxID=5353 RepID=UPI001BF2F61E|nr:uncharacterized protein C8R40DRAFT_1235261 [Lentinula edodes]KAF8828396.1 hypothetical protein HHX47_DHR4000770 [Lentinula edodes]KAH7878115.1 hypothetical protein C8R40DRAFT_1235261 [Lentinula edodes]KAJ3880379.1 hypothetical protein F5051DRAFT_450774 [Lentinula edodes]KAJ3906247.1 hypothetical protein F5879DRAFT_1000407 [Lentinula edodes]